MSDLERAPPSGATPPGGPRPAAPLPAARRETFFESIADNALLSWSLRRARREPATLVFALGFVAVLYGVTALMSFVVLRPGFGGSLHELLQGIHVLTWSLNAIMLCLVVPLRLAQQVATERERRTLELLRMTAIPTRSLALGAVAAAYSLPLLLCSMSIPLVLVGLLSKKLASPSDAAAAYLGMASTSILYTMIAGASAFAPKKAAQASGAALLVVLGLAGFSGLFRVPHCEPTGCLGPWGALLGSWDNPDRFVVSIFGLPFPGLAIQVPFQLIVAFVFFHVLARKLASDDAFALGVRGGTLVAVVLGLIAGMTFAETPASRPWGWNRAAGDALGARYILLFFALLPVAMDSAVLREALVRGLSRPRGDRPRADERIRPYAAALGAALAAVVMTLVLIFGIAHENVAPSTPFDLKGLLVAAVSLVSFIAVAASMFQAARLLAPNTAPNTLAGAALLVVWLVPLFATKALRQLDLPLELTTLPLVLSPFSVLFQVAESAVTAPSTTSAIAPVSLGLASILVNGLIVGGLTVVVRRGESQAEELARSLVALPADAFGVAPGGLGRTCDHGHVFEAKWDSCPHCK